MPTTSDPTRHDGDHRAARHAAIAPKHEHRHSRRVVDLERTAELALANAVAMKPDAAPNGPTCLGAVRTRTRARSLDRGRPREPPLDVEPVVDDV